MGRGRQFHAQHRLRKLPSLPPAGAALFGLVAAMLIMASPAHAALGNAYASVEADRAHLSATLTSTNAGTYAVHTLTLVNGGVTREYTRGDGAVFAITWHGPSRPDLRQLLGGHFNDFQADNLLRGGRRSRRPLSSHRTDFVAQSGGHSGAFWGVAYIPQLMPAGFSAKDFQ